MAQAIAEDAAGRRLASIASCTGWGLQRAPVSRSAGELLPRLSILTAPKDGGLFLLHFPWSRLRRPLAGTLALRCPDFPHARRPATVCSPRTSDSICFSGAFVNAGEGKNRLTCPFAGDIISICQRKAKLSSGSAKVLGESRPAACACSSVG